MDIVEKFRVPVRTTEIKVPTFTPENEINIVSKYSHYQK